MAETYGELITRLCQLRDEMRRTPQGLDALADIVDVLVYMKYRKSLGLPITYEQAKEKIR